MVFAQLANAMQMRKWIRITSPDALYSDNFSEERFHPQLYIFFLIIKDITIFTSKSDR
jgi:hypothetical protein